MNKQLSREEMINDLVEFIAGVRKEEIKYWWIGELSLENPHPVLISTSMRGHLRNAEYWVPMEDELAPCCQYFVEKEEKEGKLKDFEWMQHCVSDEHIRNLLEQRSDEKIQAEYTYMLESIMNTLTQSI